MALCVAIAFVLLLFVKVKLTDYNTKNVKQQLKQIVSVSQRHLVLFQNFTAKGLRLAHSFLSCLNMPWISLV